MAEISTKKPRMYDPWGYQDENNYQSAEVIMENDLDSFFVDATYNKDDNKIHFTNKDGEELVTIDVSEFDKSDKIVERAWYEDGKIYIKFTNGDLVTIDVEELIDENEFKGGLQVNDGVVSVLIDPSTEPYITASDDGVKISGVDAAIQVETDRATSAETVLNEKIEAETARAEAAEQALDEKIEAEAARATSAETDLQAAIEAEGQRAQDAESALNSKINQEISDREADVDAEETRAKAREDEIEAALNAEKTRATQTEGQLNHRIDVVNDELDSEEARAQSAEQEIRTNLASEIADRKADVDAEEARAKAAEQALQTVIGNESDRAISAETVLDGKINQEIADRKAEAVADVSYDSESKSIIFNNKNGETISTIDAEPFIKDGMIDSVELVELSGDTYLRITWNTDSGKEVTDINIGDIFDADNYYTKDETDALVEEEKQRAISAETTLDEKIEAETARATSAETDLQAAIDAEELRALSAETVLSERIEEVASGSSIELVNELIERLGYTDNDTLNRNNGGSEVAFGNYNISTQSDDPAQKTLFSIGNGTDDANRSNALEVKQNGDVYMWVEGEFMNINVILAQIAHEVFDSDAAQNNPHYFDGD